MSDLRCTKHFRALTAMSPLQFQKPASPACRAGNACSGVNWMRQVPAFEVGYRKPEPISIASTGDSLASPQWRDIKALQAGKVVAITTA